MISFKIPVFQWKHSHDNCGRQAVGMLIRSGHRYCCFLHYYDRSETVNMTAPLWTQLETLVKSPKAHEGGSCAHEVNCTHLSLSRCMIMGTKLLQKRTCTYCEEQVTAKTVLQHKVTNAISSPGSMCWKLILYNIRGTTFPSRAFVTVLKVVKMSCFYRQRPGGKNSIFTRQPMCKKQNTCKLQKPQRWGLAETLQQHLLGWVTESFIHLLWIHSHKFNSRALHPAPMEYNHQSGFPAAHAPRMLLVVTGTVRRLQLSTAYTFPKAEVAAAG